MGASFITIELDGNLTEKEVREAFKHQQEEDAWSCGHEYSGQLNMCSGLTFHRNRTFETISDAVEWLDEHVQKWENAECVRVSSPKEPKTWWVIGGLCAS
jgi:hypothetical protein